MKPLKALRNLLFPKLNADPTDDTPGMDEGAYWRRWRHDKQLFANMLQAFLDEQGGYERLKEVGEDYDISACPERLAIMQDLSREEELEAYIEADGQLKHTRVRFLVLTEAQRAQIPAEVLTQLLSTRNRLELQQNKIHNGTHGHTGARS